MKNFELPKASKREHGVDLISTMPDHILVLILSRLPSTEEVIRTSILSTRWRYLWTSVPSVDIEYPDDLYKSEKLDTNDFIEFVYWVLVNKSVDLDSFSLDCVHYYDMSIVGRWIHAAIARNVKQLDLTFWPDEQFIELPHCLVACRTLEVLKLRLISRGLRLPKVKGFPALRVLELSYVDLLTDEDLVKSFLQNCPLLEDLTLMGCLLNGLDLLCISCPNLKKLRIDQNDDDDDNNNDENIRRMCSKIKIHCPKLVFLELAGPIAYYFFFESLDSLKEVVIVPEGLPPAPDAELIGSIIYPLFPGISHVESLRIGLYFFCKCISAACDPALPNLKTLVLTTTFDDFTMDDLSQILKYYPKVESLKLIIKERFSVWEKRKLDEAEIRSSINPDLKRVEFLEFIGEKPKLVFEHRYHWFDGYFMEMVFSWGNKPKYSH